MNILFRTLLSLLFFSAMVVFPLYAETPQNPATHDDHNHAGEASRPAANINRPHVEVDHHEESAGHGHEDGPGTIHNRPFNEISELSCEHDMKTIDCNNCRFEVGVVRIDLKSTMFKIEKPTLNENKTSLELPGESRYAADRIRAVVPRFPARILSVSVRMGDILMKGDPLAELESPDLAQAALEFLKKSAELSFASQRKLRDGPLAEKKVISDQEYRDSRLAYELASIEVILVKKRLLFLGLDEETIDQLAMDRNHPALLGRFTLRAPDSGRIVYHNCVVGETAAADKPLFTIADLSKLWVVAQCHERDIPRLQAALNAGTVPVELSVISSPDHRFTGQIFALDPAISHETRTLPVWIEVENQDRLLLADTFGLVKVFLPAAGKSLSLPEEAVLEDEGRSFVFVRGRDNLFVTKIVTARPLAGRRFAVTGLSADAEVVTRGAFLLKSDVLREKMGAGCAD